MEQFSSRQRRIEDEMAATRVPIVQRKLRVGSTDDPAEHEADRVADQVLAAIRADSAAGTSPIRTDAGAAGRIRRAPHRLDGGANVVGADTEARIQRMRGRGAALPEPMRQTMESAFATDFSHVRVHRSGESSRLSDELSARAFTTGNDVFLGSSVDLSSRDGTRLMAHELTHVVQQGSTAVRRTAVSADVVRRDPKKKGTRPLQSIDESAHYGHSRDDEHRTAKTALEAADGNSWTISTKLYNHHKPDGKSLTTSIKSGDRYLVVCTFADKSSGRLTYHTAYMSKTPAAGGIPNTTYWQPHGMEIAA